MSGFAEYEEYDGLGLAELVEKGEVSAAELVNEAIARIEKYDPQLNAVVHTCFERARQQAAGDLPGGPFRGVPFLLKDLLAEDAGEPSTASCQLLQHWRAQADCELVARFKRAGLVILGRTNTPEFGILGITESEFRGPCFNPWSLEHTPGGSSGGSAAAVASRLVPMAHGGDGGGSIRIPSSACALFGLKPSRGRSPMGPQRGQSWQGLVVEHVLTRSVRDSAAMLDAIHGPDRGALHQVAPPSEPFLKQVGKDPGKLRIAFTTTALFGNQTHPDCVQALREQVALAEMLGHQVEEACPSFDRHELVRAYLTVVAVCTSASVADVANKTGRQATASDLEAVTWLLKQIGEKISAPDFVRINDLMHRAGRDLMEFFTDFDVLLTPTMARPPVRFGELDPSTAERFQLRILRALPVRVMLMKALDQMAEEALASTANTMLFNLAGLPAMSVPLFWNQAGLPVGTQWVADFGNEATLFQLASQLEEARPWKDRRPPLLEE